SIMCLPLFFIMLGCNESVSVPEDIARQLTVEQAVIEPGFTWLQPTMDTYTPNAESVKQIADSYSADPNRSVIVYVNPGCSCVGSRKYVPHALKTLQAAGIPSSKITIFTMRTASGRHPHSDKYILEGLPSVYILKGTTTTFYFETKNEVSTWRSATSSRNTVTEKDAIETVLAQGFAL
ncbi:MAG TPA: hypothetical protein PLQ21_03770, partial [Candidatus Kapabacteria bacterium]|nr:hypothetical protein [Candidatus Kapabacteria bacterium]